jgi:hypothetical protein
MLVVRAKNSVFFVVQVHFENSLGKLTTSNFHHPRALIELDKASQDNDDKHKETKNICTILLEIEKVIFERFFFLLKTSRTKQVRPKSE